MKKYDSYKDSGVKWLGEIPSHWEMLPGLAVFQENKCKNSDLSVNNVFSLSYGKIIEKKDINEGLVPAEYNTYQIVHPGYIIIRCTDLQNDKVSLRTGLVKNDGIITNAYLGLVVNKEYNYSYIHYFLHAWDITKEIYRYGSGLRQSLSWLDLRRLPILLPSLQEQETIANYLDSATSKIDEAIAQQQKMIDLLNERKQIIINNAVTKGLDPNVKMKSSGIDWIGDIPEGWEVLALKYILKQKKQLVGKESYKYELLSLTLRGIIKRDMENPDGKWPASFDTYQEVNPGDFVFCNFDNEETPRAVGLSSYRGMITGAYDVMKCINERLDINYLYYYFLYIDDAKRFKPLYKGLRKTIPTDSFMSYKIPIPTKEEQCKIVDYLDEQNTSINEVIERINNQISLLQERKQIIINDVVTGKVKVF